MTEEFLIIHVSPFLVACQNHFVEKFNGLWLNHCKIITTKAFSDSNLKTGAYAEPPNSIPLYPLAPAAAAVLTPACL